MRKIIMIKVIAWFWLVYGLLSMSTWLLDEGRKLTDLLAIIGIGLFLTLIYVTCDLMILDYIKAEQRKRETNKTERIIKEPVETKDIFPVKENKEVLPVKKIRKIKPVKNTNETKDVEEVKSVKEVKQESNLTPAHFDNVIKENSNVITDLD